MWARLVLQVLFGALEGVMVVVGSGCSVMQSGWRCLFGAAARVLLAVLGCWSWCCAVAGAGQLTVWREATNYVPLVFSRRSCWLPTNPGK